MTDKEIIEKAKKIAACVPFIDNGAGVAETQECIRGLIQRIRVLGEEVEAVRRVEDDWGDDPNVDARLLRELDDARAATDAARRGA